MIRRKAVMIQKILMLLSCVAYLVCIFVTDNSLLRSGLCLALIATTGWHIGLTRCPHCGRFGGLKHKLPLKNGVKCIHCGALTQYQ